MNRLFSAASYTLSFLAFTSFDAFAANYNAAAGKAVYEANCVSCHKDGIMGAPKTGNKPSWAPRIEQGMDVLVSKSIKGYQGKKGLCRLKAATKNLPTQKPAMQWRTWSASASNDEESLGCSHTSINRASNHANTRICNQNLNLSDLPWVS